MILLVVWIILGGLIVYGAYRLPIKEGFKIAVYVVVVICLLCYVLYAFGILPMRDVPVPQIR